MTAGLFTLVTTLALAAGAKGDDVRYVAASVANVRKAPSAEAALVGKLPIGSRVIVEKCAKKFCRVRVQRRRVEGYVAESLLERSPPNYPALLSDAARALERACALSPKDATCLVALESAYRANGKTDAADRVRKVIERQEQQRLAVIAPTAGAPMIHDLGEHHGDEVHARDGEEWFAFCDDAFRAVKVGVRPVKDELLDEEGGPMTGREVTAPCEASVLVKGIPRFDPKRVRAAVAHEDGSYELDGQRIALRAEGAEAVFVDEKSKKRTAVGALDLEESGAPTVLFAGDLDSDGKLDFVAGFSDHYNVSALHLFLSSASRDWAPKEVATHRDTGC